MKTHAVRIAAAVLASALSVGLIVPALATQGSASTESAPAASAHSLSSARASFNATEAYTPGAVPSARAKSTSTAPSSAKRSTKRTIARHATRNHARTATSHAARTITKRAASSGESDASVAKSVLADLKATYRYLDGATVEIGKTPGNYQAVSYYRSGRIVISPSHRASITTILRHEIWHIIDWADNGKIDWGERVAPKNASDYRK